MSKKTFLPEPLVWLVGLVLAGALALPLALVENGLSLGSLWLPFRSGALTARLLQAEHTSPQPPTLKSEFPLSAVAEAVALTPKPGLLDDLRQRVRPQLTFSSYADKYEDLIKTTAREHQVSPLLIKAVIQAESKFDPSAVSHKGAVGLMQVMPFTARDHGIDNLLDPKMNLEAGVRHLKKLLEAFDDDEILALAAYNCGTEAMKRFNNEIPPFPETRSYVKRVMSYYSQHLES